MLGFKKPSTSDPQESIDETRKTVNSGLIGGLTKMFMGQSNVDKINQGLDSAQDAIDESKEMQELMTSGEDAQALVKELSDTGRLVNYNPVLKLKLEINPGGSESYEVEVEKMVSKIAIPRIGDTLLIKVSKEDKNKFAITGIAPSSVK